MDMWNKFKDIINAKRLNIQSKIRKYRLQHSLKEVEISHLRPTLVCNHKWYGSDYGGFYLHPKPLNTRSIIYSFGIGKDISFDRECIQKHNCKVYAFDPTPKSINWIASQTLPKNFHFHPYGIATKSGPLEFFAPKDKISGSTIRHNAISDSDSIVVEMKSLVDIIAELGHSRIDILKMDIEGAEYDILKGLKELTIPVDQLLVEFHDRLFEDSEPRSKETIKMLNELGFEIFASSVSYEEISLMHRRLLM